MLVRLTKFIRSIPGLLWICLAIAFFSCNRHAAPDGAGKLTGQGPDSLLQTPAGSFLPKNEPHLLASLRRAPCYGRCPVYEVQFYSNGQAVYQGERYVKRLGIYLAQVPGAGLDSILEHAQQAGFFSLADTYPENGHTLEGLPETTTFVNNGQRQKAIKDNYDAPLALIHFEQFLDELAQSLDWQPNVE